MTLRDWHQSLSERLHNTAYHVSSFFGLGRNRVQPTPLRTRQINVQRTHHNEFDNKRYSPKKPFTPNPKYDYGDMN